MNKKWLLLTIALGAAPVYAGHWEAWVPVPSAYGASTEFVQMDIVGEGTENMDFWVKVTMDKTVYQHENIHCRDKTYNTDYEIDRNASGEVTSSHALDEDSQKFTSFAGMDGSLDVERFVYEMYCPEGSRHFVPRPLNSIFG